MRFFKRKENVYLPECKSLTSANLMLDGKPYVGVFNLDILKLKPKDVFAWFLSLTISYDKTVGDNMPLSEDVPKMQDFSDLLSEKLAGDPNHPNAFFLGRVTGAGHTEVMWYVNNPETAHQYLQSLIGAGAYPLEFDYRISGDEKWKNAHFWLDPLI